MAEDLERKLPGVHKGSTHAIGFRAEEWLKAGYKIFYNPTTQVYLIRDTIPPKYLIYVVDLRQWWSKLIIVDLLIIQQYIAFISNYFYLALLFRK